MASVKREVRLELKAEVEQYKRDLLAAGKITEDLGRSAKMAALDVQVAAARKTVASEAVKEAERNLQKAQNETKTTAKELGQAELALVQAKRDDEAASESLAEAEKQLAASKLHVSESAEKQTTVMGRFTDFIGKNSDGVRAAATGMVAFGGAVTALGAAALKTGIEYNTLQQTTRKALTTLTGSAEAANAQMDKLDAFAKTSPFAKGAFISAQQQMMAFGIEAHKVIPYLEGINDAVAASGGNSQMIGEIAFIMAQISAASKITATDLMQFGQRGIDAATLIGDQMGKTGQQIRSEITAGTLDADVALDALAAGMSTKFEGAAAGVKDTFAGAVDRLKANWREFGAMLAEPLVGQEGGGWLVSWANAAADAAGAFRELPGPIQWTTVALVGLAGVGTLGAGSFLLAAPRILATRDALASLATQMPRTTSVMKTAGKVAGIAAVAIGGIYAAATYRGGDATQGIEEITDGLRRLADGATAADTVFKNSDGGSFFRGTTMDLKELSAVLNDDSGWTKFDRGTADALTGLNKFVTFGLYDARAEWQVQRDELAAYGTQLGTLAKSDLPTAQGAFQRLAKEAGGTEEAQQNLLNLMPDLRDSLIGVASDAGLATDDATLLKIAMGDLDPAIDGVKTASEQAAIAAEAHATALQAQIDAADAAWEAMNKLAGGVLDARSAHRDYLDAIDAVTEAVEKNGKTLDDNTASGRANQEALDNMAVKGLAEINLLRDRGASYDELKDAMGNVRDALIDQAIELGATDLEAQEYVNTLGLFPDEVRTKFDAETQEARQDTDLLESYITKMGDNLDDWTITADGKSAIRTSDGVKYTIDRTTGEVTITGSDDKARAEARAARDYINAMHASIKVTAAITRYETIKRNAVNNAASVINNLWGKQHGGRAGLPAFSDGGRLPSTGLGTDQILGIGSDGTPTAWVDDREWIINRRSSDKFNPLLRDINADAPGVQALAAYGTGTGIATPLPAGIPANPGSGAFDYDRMAQAISGITTPAGTTVTIKQTNINPEKTPTSVATRDALAAVGALGLVGTV